MYSGRSLKSGGTYTVLILLALLSFTSLTAASTPTSFCKCTCFSNSTIIPLASAKSGSTSSYDNTLNLFGRAFGLESDPSPELEDRDNDNHARTSEYRGLSCTDCNRKFCLNYDLPICKDAKEEDVFTTCFQRDSQKDEAVVFIFIFATGGLLAWAVLKPWIERYLEAARERRSYIPVAEPDS
ncbi:hypothetical protein N7495_002935 [Penicillium taxi]|uniref:uncharacterized protein n=1 Tax=Penicillium taxi TaxID=168475 RepID=UPI002545872D|nr:uncharacterized protein N7495_002935 [Penicillium taxi]KAJ5902407.1 hypothetical protein N7495_002935 [Penicillium taxi]